MQKWNRREVLIAYNGGICDVSGSWMWRHGPHFWIPTGQDLTGRLREGPHGPEMLEHPPCVGVLVD